MNTYMESQIMNMKAMVKTFEAGCRMAAMKNDGTIDKTEEKQLKKNQRRLRQISERTEQREVNQKP